MSLHFSFIFNFKIKQIENIKRNQFNLTDSQRNLILYYLHILRLHIGCLLRLYPYMHTQKYHKHKFIQ